MMRAMHDSHLTRTQSESTQSRLGQVPDFPLNGVEVEGEVEGGGELGEPGARLGKQVGEGSEPGESEGVKLPWTRR